MVADGWGSGAFLGCMATKSRDPDPSPEAAWLVSGGPTWAQRQASWWGRGQVGDGGESHRSVCPALPLPRATPRPCPRVGACTPGPSHCQPAVPGGRVLRTQPQDTGPWRPVCPEPQQGQDEDQSWGLPSPGPTGPTAQRRTQSGQFPHALCVLTAHSEAQAGSLMGNILMTGTSEISIGQKQSLSTSKCRETPQRASLSYGCGCLL